MKRVLKTSAGLTLAVIAISLAAIICQAQSGWTSKRIGSGGKDLNAVYFTDAKHGWAGGDSGFLCHTEDGGATWAERPIGTEHSINDIYFVSKDAGFVLAGGSIFRTDDGGQSWSESQKFSPSEFADAAPELYSLRFNGKKRGWVVGSVSRRVVGPTGRRDVIENSILAITRDGGATWELLHAPTQQELIHIAFVNEKHAWIVGAGGTILHTDDAGDSWTKQNSQTTETLYHVDFRNEKQGWAVGEEGVIVLTIDGGRNWTKVDSPVRSILLSVQFVGEGDGWIVGHGGVILRSGDGGRTWIEQESTTKQNLYALFMNKKNGWAVGTDGLILRYER
ncbi:MAG TPA: YCF48-related protein [Pyrinomonadaceae bacterium]|nr:YCF48-related protein [Pyrinomonadaceae bacterium]